MTPIQKLKWAILSKAASWDGTELPTVTADNVDQLYDDLVAADGHCDCMEEIRSTGIRSNLSRSVDYQAQRHYEHDEVAAEMPDGSWVGWTYWHSGGKFGEPSAVPWMELAYDVSHREQPKVIIEHIFSLPAEVA